MKNIEKTSKFGNFEKISEKFQKFRKNGFY